MARLLYHYRDGNSIVELLVYEALVGWSAEDTDAKVRTESERSVADINVC
ncbi:MAG: hypothetical protein AAF608_13645 [Pseudomonadota bacterium]